MNLFSSSLLLYYFIRQEAEPRVSIEYYYLQSASVTVTYYLNKSRAHQIQHVSHFNTRFDLVHKWNQVLRLGYCFKTRSHTGALQKELDNAAIEVLIKLVMKIKCPCS